MSRDLHAAGHRKALVTGASSGLGASIASALANDGLQVVAWSRSGSGETHASGVRHETVDLLRPSGLEAALRALETDPPDVWINNAGHGLLGGGWSPSDSEISDISNLLYHVPVRLTRFFRKISEKYPDQPHFLVQVSSLAVELPIPDMPYYNAAKSALSAFTQSLLLDGRLPFRLIDFRPGDYNTPFPEKCRNPGSGTEARTRQHNFAERHRRAPSPDDAAKTLVRAMRRGRVGTVRSGTVFQSKIAPQAARFLPEAVLRGLIRRHYDGH